MLSSAIISPSYMSTEVTPSETDLVSEFIPSHEVNCSMHLSCRPPGGHFIADNTNSGFSFMNVLRFAIEL